MAIELTALRARGFRVYRVGELIPGRKGVRAGPELVKNGTFESNVAQWVPLSVASLTWDAGRMAVTKNATGDYPSARQAIFTNKSGKVFRIRGDVINPSGLSAYLAFNGVTDSPKLNVSGSFDYYQTANAVSEFIQAGLWLSSGQVGQAVTFDNISVREIFPAPAGGPLVNLLPAPPPEPEPTFRRTRRPR